MAGSEKIYKIYKLTFPNNKVYVGMTCQNINRRARKQCYTNCPRIYKAILKYGWENIKVDILCNGLSKTEAMQMEINKILEYKSNEKEYGYNLDLGTKHCNQHTENSISNRRSYKSENNPFYGKHWTTEQKENQFKNRRSYDGINNPNAKSIKCLETGEIFKTLKEACINKNISKPLLIGVLKGKYKQAKGFTYVYLERR